MFSSLLVLFPGRLTPLHASLPPSLAQVPGSGPPEEDDPSSLSFSHVEALETIPILHETWAWAEEGGRGGKQGPFVVSMDDYTVAWILKE